MSNRKILHPITVPIYLKVYSSESEAHLPTVEHDKRKAVSLCINKGSLHIFNSNALIDYLYSVDEREMYHVTFQFEGSLPVSHLEDENLSWLSARTIIDMIS